MEAVELKDKLIKQFQTLIQDESMLVTLDGVFDAINVNSTDTDGNSLVPDEHYKNVEIRHEKRLNSQTTGQNWDEVKFGLKQKYGF